MATGNQTPAAGTANGSGNTATPGKPGRKPRDPNAVRKASPKVKALTETRTYLLQQQERELEGKTGTARAVEAERFERMLDSVENLFPANHRFNIPRTNTHGQQVTQSPASAGGAAA